jgi:hypothetical protein
MMVVEMQTWSLDWKRVIIKGSHGDIWGVQWKHVSDMIVMVVMYAAGCLPRSHCRPCYLLWAVGAFLGGHVAQL